MVDALGLAGEGVFKRNFEIVAQIRAAFAPAAVRHRADRAPRQEILEDIRHEVGEIIAETGASRTAGPALRESLVAEAVIGRTALGIRQGLVGLVEFLEAQFGFPHRQGLRSG